MIAASDRRRRAGKIPTLTAFAALLPAVLFACAAALAEAPPAPLPAGMVERAFPFDGGERRFLSFRPARLRPGAPVLLIEDLYGWARSLAQVSATSELDRVLVAAARNRTTRLVTGGSVVWRSIAASLTQTWFVQTWLP